MIYLYIVVAIAFAAVSGYAAIEHSGKVAAEAELGACNTKIVSQNAAIATTKADGDRRVAEASKGVAKATKATQAARTEAERLAELLKNPPKPGACPAASGVAEIRRGLR